MEIIALEIIIIAVAYALVAFVIQRKVSNAERMKQIRDEINKLQKEMNEMLKNKAPAVEVRQKQETMMSLLGESTKSQLKATAVVFPMFLIIYYVLLPNIFSTVTTVSVLSNTLNYKTLFIIAAFVAGILALLLISVYERLKKATSNQNKPKE